VLQPGIINGGAAKLTGADLDLKAVATVCRAGPRQRDRGERYGSARGRYFLEPDNVMEQPAYTQVNSSLSWRPSNHRCGVTLWDKNLTNEAVIS
jgi:outer membrane receptor protein involved in Fe transport